MSVPRIVRRVAAGLLVAVVTAPAASAATTVGQNPLPPADAAPAAPPSCVEACTVALLRDRAGRDAAVPADGVLTAVLVRGAAGAGDPVVVRVLRPDGTGAFAPVATAGTVDLDGSGTVQELAVRVPVRAGDVLAVRGPAPPPVLAAATGDGTLAVFGEPPVWPVGAPARTAGPDDAVGGDLLVAARLEPDGDADGHGDETQDDCPADPARTGACVVDLRTAAVAPEYEVGGRPVVHAFTVRNGGPSPADAELAVELVQGADVTAVAAPGACVPADGVVLRCDLGRLAPGADARVALTLVGPAGSLAGTWARALARGSERLPGDESDLARTLFTAASVAPAPRPWTVAPCANVRTGTGDDDLLTGTSFGDRLIGRAGRDLLRGGGGPDCLEGGPGDDVLDGGAGDDRLAGAAGADRLQGGFGSDTLRGGLGDDVLLGGSGDDLLLPGPGADRVVAGDGDDTVDTRDRRRESVDCGRGSDSARVDRVDRVRGCERVARG